MRILANITLFIDLLIAAAIFILKIIYYINKLNNGYFQFFISFLIWTFVSVVISIAPVTLLIIPNVADLIGKGDIIRYDIFVISSISGIVFNILFEFVSALGGGMCMDTDWVDIALRMVLCHFVTIVPFIMSIFLNMGQRAMRKNTKNEQNNEIIAGGKGDRYI